MDTAERNKIARAYVEYATWFVREGCEKFGQFQEKMRESFSPQFSAIASAIPQGLAALTEALHASSEVFQASVDELGFEQHPAEWANERVREIIITDGDEGWKMIREIVKVAPDEADVLGFIGAGHFEHWVSEERVLRVQEDFLQGLKTEAKLAYVVGSSWAIPPSLEGILRKAGLWGKDDRPIRC